MRLNHEITEDATRLINSRGIPFTARVKALRKDAARMGDRELVEICNLAIEDPTTDNPFAVGVAKLILHLISAP